MKRSTGVRAALLVLAAGAGAGVLLALARNVHGSGRTVALAGRRAMLGRARMCLSLLATEPELSHARPWTVLHKCMRQVKKTVEKWKTCDECVECKNTGSDCGLCADVLAARHLLYYHYQRAVLPRGLCFPQVLPVVDAAAGFVYWQDVLLAGRLSAQYDNLVG